MDCFFIGRLCGSKGSVWQYTAIDVASVYTWAELHASERNPRSRDFQSLPHRLAHDLALAGWKLATVTTDNGSKLTNQDFAKIVHGADGRNPRPTHLQRLRRTRAADDPRGMLESQLRPLTRCQANRPPP